jgi:hypothetical protein
MGHLKRLAVAAAVTTLAAVGLAATPAQAEPTGSFLLGTPVPGGYASWAELLGVQERMNAAADRIEAAARANPGSGYAGVVADPLSRELKVYWKGQAPANLTAIARATVPVRLLPAAHSERELTAAAARLWARADDAVTLVGPRVDGAGLRVGTAGRPIPASYAGVPVTVDTSVKPVAATRVNDAAPWTGGARWVNATRNRSCSTGFAVRQSNANRMLSAAHCGSAAQVANDPTGEQIGAIGSDVNANDVLVINANSRGRVYNNTINSTGGVASEFNNAVVGTQSNQVGNIVCTSGSFSGTRCDLQIVAIGLCFDMTHDIEGTTRVCGQVEANHRFGGNAAGGGDSGGAVLVANSANTTQVFARGTATAIDGDRPVLCTGYVTANRKCSSAVYYEDITSGLAAVGATGVVLG